MLTYAGVTTQNIDGIGEFGGCLHSPWPWKRDAAVSEDCALMMMMMMLINRTVMYLCKQDQFLETKTKKYRK